MQPMAALCNGTCASQSPGIALDAFYRSVIIRDHRFVSIKLQNLKHQEMGSVSHCVKSGTLRNGIHSWE